MTRPKKTAPKKATPKKTTPKKAAAKNPAAKTAPAEPAPKAVPPVEVAPPAQPVKGVKATKATKAALPKKAPAKKAPTKKVAKQAAPAKATAKKTAAAESLTPAKKAIAKSTAPRAAAPKKAPEKKVSPAVPQLAASPPPASPPPPAIRRTRPALLAAIQANPRYLPELLAQAAVDHLGAEARTHTEWLRETYPTASQDAVARLVTQRFVREARNRGAAAGLTGLLAVLVETAGLNWTQARLVLHLAGAYGHDPTHPVRAAELLALQRVHASVETAQAALDAAGNGPGKPAAARQAANSTVTPRSVAPLGRAVGSGVLLAGAARMVGRLVPGAGFVVGAVAGARSTERLAVRATAYYRALARMP